MNDDTTPERAPRPNRRTRREGERGIAVAMTGLLLVPLLIFAAFGVDLASWYARISALQRGADAAALAGAVWMPALDTACARAEDSLLSNDLHPSVTAGTVTFTCERGASATALRVTVTDNDADRHFSSVFVNGPAVLSRYAEAEYNLPLPLGSPLNYFGGDTTRVPDPPPAFSWNSAWPSDIDGPQLPVDSNSGDGLLDCHVTTDSNLTGRWAGLPTPTYRSTEFGSGSTCAWTVGRTDAGGTPSATPPPDYDARRPTQIASGTSCRVMNGATLIGYWRFSGQTGTPRFLGPAAWSGTGAPTTGSCTWTNSTTTYGPIAAHPLGMNPLRTSIPAPNPVNRPCRVGYAAADGWFATSTSAWTNSGTMPAALNGGPASGGNRLCAWSAVINDTTTDAGPAIDPSRSPGFWAAIEGPQVRAFQGDPYSTRCYDTGQGCTVVANAQYQDLASNNRGTWYVVSIPAGLTGTVDINIFDAAYNPVGTDTLAGDRTLDTGAGTSTFTTQFQMWQQDNVLDFTVRSRQGWAAGDPPDTAGTAGDCNWGIVNPSSHRGAWQTLCTLTGVTPGERYLINVQTTGTTGTGVNGYALEAVANGSHSSSPQPALYAYSHMTMQNNNTCDNDSSTATPPCPPPDATFYLAEVGQQYAGKTLVLDLWDAGDVSGGAEMTPMMPSTTNPRPVVPVPASSCTFTATSSPNARISGTTGTEYTSATAPDGGTECMIISATGGTGRFNGEWLRIRIQIPATYTCTAGVNPETTAGSCWWGVRYHFTASANDVTTWSARIEGNPLQLTE